MLYAKINIYLNRLTAIVRIVPRRFYLIGGFLLVCAIIVGVVFLPQSIQFSYTGKTCVYQPTIAPGLLTSRSDAFRLEAAQRLSVAGVTIASFEMCIVPLKAPEPGEHRTGLSLTGLSLIQKPYTIEVPAAPALASIGERPLSVSRPLMVPMSSPDEVFTYRLIAGDKGVGCRAKNGMLQCDVPGLTLEQGREYSLILNRYFNGEKVSTVKRHNVTTLTATTVVDSSIKQGQRVFAKPRSIELIADKNVVDASVRLVHINGDKRQQIDTKTTVDGKKIALSWNDDLPRQAKFEVIANRVTGTDGSGLDGAYVVTFETSGGPKVTNISAGSYKVPLGSTVAITFDQPLLASQDISKALSANGGAVVTGMRANMAYVSFAGVPRCGGVTITVTDSLQSEYGITGGSAWAYSTRTICQAIGSIGTSVKGRPIVSYSFGSGSQVVVYTGAIHGNEASTKALMYRWIDELEANPNRIPANRTVVVIPMMNPDGVAAGTRTNARNVDLNRNFATSDWKSDITTVTNAPFPKGGGDVPASEPETQAIASYIAKTRPQLVLSYHSIGGLLAANQTGNSSGLAMTYARLSGYVNTTGSVDAFEYGISGTADDYYGERLGVPSILIELGSHTYHQFERNRDAMWTMLQ